MTLARGEGLEIIQSFDPIPLYEVMEDLGYEHHTEKTGDAEYHAYFYRTEEKHADKDIPMRPAALTNMPSSTKNSERLPSLSGISHGTTTNATSRTRRAFSSHLRMPSARVECARRHANS